VNSEDDPLVLAKLFKVFKDIPTDVSLDIFGEIYENYDSRHPWISRSHSVPSGAQYPDG
jgi:hypothetical protein